MKIHEFASIGDCFFDNRWSDVFSKHYTKCVSFSRKHTTKANIIHRGKIIGDMWWYKLDISLDENLSGKLMVTMSLKEISFKRQLFYKINIFLNPEPAFVLLINKTNFWFRLYILVRNDKTSFISNYRTPKIIVFTPASVLCLTSYEFIIIIWISKTERN